jgi:molybdopterin-binding protein
MATVELEIAASTMTAAITAASVERLSLKTGDDVVAIIKATDVMIGK